MNTPLSLKRSQMIFIIGLLVIYVFIFQNARGVWEPSEGRYTCVATEIIRSGDWVHPQLNDDTPHWTKPPITYWALATCIKLFGHNTFAVRLPSALAFFFTTLLVYSLGCVFVPERPWLPAFIYATFIFTFISSSIITTDSILSMFETAAMAGFASAYWNRGPRLFKRYGAQVGWIAFGLAFMTKGPPALLPLLAFWLYHFLASKDKQKIRVIKPVSGLALFFLVGGIWYMYVILQNHSLFYYFIRDEIAARVLTGQHHRNPQWYGAVVIYIPTLLIGTLPWSVDVWRSIRTMITEEWQVWVKKSAYRNEQDRFLLFWLFIPLMIFFFSKSRLALYILPLFVPLSIAAARRLDIERFKKQKRIYLLIVWCSALLALRGLSAFVPMTSDNRLLAGQIKNLANMDGIEEIIFVGTKPYLGLSLYFNAEVEKVRIDQTRNPESKEEYLKDELTAYEKGRLWIVPHNLKDSFLRIVEEQDFNVKPLGHVKGHTAYELFMDGRHTNGTSVEIGHK